MSTWEIVSLQIGVQLSMIVMLAVYLTKNPEPSYTRRAYATGVTVFGVLAMVGVSLWLQNQNLTG